MRKPPPTIIGGVFLAWLAAIAIDFFAYGGVFAGFFVADDASVLSPQQLFVRIPAGYASFLIEVVALAWLLNRTGVSTSTQASRLGGAVGLAGGAALVLGVWSFSPISPGLLLSWWLVLVVQMSIEGWILATWRNGERRKVGRFVIVVVVSSVLGGVLIQNAFPTG